MNHNSNLVPELKEKLESILEKLKAVPESLQHKAESSILRCRECLKEVPDTDTPVYIHITGTDKSFKTSYLLDLFDNDDLRAVFDIKASNNSENTAVPCLVEPSREVSKIRIRQVYINSGEVIRDDLNNREFIRLYDLGSGANPAGYLIQILVPAGDTPMQLPVIEYPGIKQGADTLKEHRQRHQTFQQDLLMTLARYPGIMVACFQHKIAIPPGHPLDVILGRYREVLRSTGAGQRLPLIVSMQGTSAVAGFCGHTNVLNDIENDFKSNALFDTTIQLVNPCNREWPVAFTEPGPYVDQWIRKMSRYANVAEIQESIALDGGISRSRRLLGEVCSEDGIRDALDSIFLKPWIREARASLSQAVERFNEINTHDELVAFKEKIRLTLLNESYTTIRECFRLEMEVLGEDYIPNHEKFWGAIFSRYLDQFFEDQEKSRKMALRLWKDLARRLDSENKGFLGTRTEDLPYIIMNMAELYVPNALIRGDYTFSDSESEETLDAF